MTTIASGDAAFASLRLLEVLDQIPDIGSSPMDDGERAAPLHLSMIIDDVPKLVATLRRSVAADTPGHHSDLFEVYVCARLGRLELATAVAAADVAQVDLPYLRWVERVVRPAADYLGRLADAAEDYMVHTAVQSGWPD